MAKVTIIPRPIGQLASIAGNPEKDEVALFQNRNTLKAGPWKRTNLDELDMLTNDIVNVGTIDGVTVSAHAARHENGGADEVSVAGLSGLLVDNQNPTAHAAEHTDGTDDIQDATASQKGLATSTQITKLDAIRAYSSWMPPIGLSPDPADVNAEQTDANSYFLYLGTILEAITTCNFVARVKVAGTGIVWSEWAVFTGAFVPFDNASLTRRGFTDVSGEVNTTGTKVVTIALTGLSVGDGLWLAYGNDRSILATDPRLTGCGPDLIQSGVFQTIVGQPSLLSSPVTVTLESATAVPGFAGLFV